MLPAIYFKFDISPITVKYWRYKDDFSHFIVQICAIIGGVFAITGILDSLLYRFTNKYSMFLKGYNNVSITEE